MSSEKKPEFTINTIIFRNSKTAFSDDFDPTIPGIELVGSFRIASQGYLIKTAQTLDESGGSKDLHIIQYNTTYAFRYQTPEQNQSGNGGIDSKFLVEITAEIISEYLLNEFIEPPNEYLNIWGGRNVLLHTWPYWREFVQSSLQKMGLPGMTMPILPPSFVAPLPAPQAAGTK